MTTIMEREAREAPERIKEQLADNQDIIRKIGGRIRSYRPEYVVTVGRGTSDHAGVFAKYLIEVELGLPVSSAAPSVASIYGRQMKLDKALVLFISQSGRSPDILAQAEMAKKAGAFCVALVNDETAPVGDIADAVIPLKAGQEKAVAATKSYLATLSALLQLVACWSENEGMLSDLNKLPGLLAQIIDGPAQLLPADFQDMANCVVLGRGFGFAISLEIALKLKEVCAIHAEAFSSAEFFHGPVTLVEKNFTIVDMQVEDESAPFHRESMKEIKHRGACILPMRLNGIDIHPRMAPLLLLQRFYLDVEKIAVALGGNPDSPPGLCKVTRTV